MAGGWSRWEPGLGMVGRLGLGPIRSKTAIRHPSTNVKDIAGFGSVECGERHQVGSWQLFLGGSVLWEEGLWPCSRTCLGPQTVSFPAERVELGREAL